MSYYDQKFANSFPLWSKIRSDPSSYGHRFYSVFSDFMENEQSETMKTKFSLKTLTEDLDFGELYQVYLEGDDEFQFRVHRGVETVTYPTITGQMILGVSEDGEEILEDFTLSEAETLEDFLYSVPQRLIKNDTIKVNAWEVWNSSDPEVYIDLLIPERLGIFISGSTLYKKLTLVEEDQPFGGFHFVMIEGFDPNHSYIRETIQIRDDGVYQTRNLFEEITKVEWDGFDGDISIQISTQIRSNLHTRDIRVFDPYKIGVVPDLVGPLILEAYNEEISIQEDLNEDGSLDPDDTSIETKFGTGDIDVSFDGAFLRSISLRFLKGVTYRRPDGDTSEEIKEEVICEQALYDVDGNPYKVVDMAISPIDTRLYVLDTEGVIHVYEHGVNSFEHEEIEETSDETYMDIVPMQSRVKLYDTTYLWTWFRVLQAPVQSVKIRRVSPSGIELWLQDDKTWGLSENSISAWGNQTSAPERTWKDKRFQTFFDETGAWNFYITVKFWLIEEEFTSRNGVYCEQATSLKDLDTGIKDPDGIFFNKENYLAVAKDDEYTCFKCANDLFVADLTNQTILLREEYDYIEASHE